MVTKTTKLPEVDAAKRRESDLQAQEKHAAQLIADLEAKKAEYEAHLQKQVEKYMEPTPELQPRNPVRPVFQPLDYTKIPDRAYKSTSSSEVAWEKDPNMEYRLVRYKGTQPRVGVARAKGWKPLFFKDSFKGTDHYEDTTEGYVLVGDCIIMQMPKDEYQNRIVGHIKALRASREQSYEDQFHEYGEQMSRLSGQKVKTFKHYGEEGDTSDKLEYYS